MMDRFDHMTGFPRPGKALENRFLFSRPGIIMEFVKK